MAQNHDYTAIDFDNDVVEQTLQQISDNWIAFLTCHSGSTPPSGVNQGAYWLDTSNTPYELKQLNSDDSWVSVQKLTSLGRDILNNLLTEQGTMDDLWTTEHNRDGTHKNPISADIDQFKSVTWTTNSVSAVDTYTIAGDQTSTLLPDGDKGRMVRLTQPSQTVISPVENATYDSNNDETTVTLHSNRTADLDTAETIDDHEFGVVGPSESQGLPLLNVSKMLLGDGTESDSALRLGAFNLPFDASGQQHNNENVQDAIELNPLKENYLPEEGLTISNNSTNLNTQIDLEESGQLWVHDPADDTTGIIVKPTAGTGVFDISTTGAGGLINGSTRTADTWYELGVISSSDGSTVDVAGWTDANRPTASSDLPSGYDYFRAMGTPGKTWWVRTDGSSNIVTFKANNLGIITWRSSKIANQRFLLQTTSVSTVSIDTIDISNAVPPVFCKIEFNGLSIDTSGGDVVDVSGLDNITTGTNGEGQIILDTTGDQFTDQSGSIISNDQTIRLNGTNGNVNELRVNSIKSFKAVN